MTSPSATQDRYPYQNEPIWSRSEKTVARAAFDAALKRELQEVMQEAKQMANQINEPADLWDLEHPLTQRRKEIDRKFGPTHLKGLRLAEPIRGPVSNPPWHPTIGRGAQV